MKQPQLGDYIANLRKEQGLTQEELVELCNINVRTIQRIEAGNVTPRNYTIKNILRALGSSFEDLTEEIHKKPDETKNTENLLKNPNHGLLIGVLGILYILISIPLLIADLFASLRDEQIFGIYVYSGIAVLYSILLSVFYISLAFSMKTKSHLLKTCVFIFLGLEILSTVFGYFWYSASYATMGVAIGLHILYAISLIILAIPFFYSRNQFEGIFKHLGLLLAIAGACNLTFVLFPIGVVLTLLFEVLLIALMFQFYQNGRKIIN
ncbi:helix-turn-helix domain-containing protein [Nonlabens antarcticus]|uniref:helix-turn-helix domain-containing protein n=1 Tax=Nonlabens antarcticus TaxID=392714 RepID=UPI0018914212|nr:helix-turn-helix transcriptional regulator [Nonlabens antarcticus]